MKLDYRLIELASNDMPLVTGLTSVVNLCSIHRDAAIEILRRKGDMSSRIETGTPFLDDSSEAVPIRGFLHLALVSSGDCIVLTHGAGSNCNAPLLIALANEFCAAGLTVLRCDLPFRQTHPHGPPQRGSAEGDRAGLRAALAAMRKRGSTRVFLGGHSYGGRQSSMLAAAEPNAVDGLLLLSYPLHPPRRPHELRTSHFPALQSPALFVHGSRDGFGSVHEMATALELIPARTELITISGSGHELMTKANQSELPRKVVDAFLLLTNRGSA